MPSQSHRRSPAEKPRIRVRKVVGRRNHLVTSKAPSFKLGRQVMCESRAEKRFVYRLDFDPTVIDFAEQPAELQYPMDGVLHRHFPDFLVWRNTGVEFNEVKSAEDAASADVAERTKILKAALAELGIGYRIVTHEEINAEPSLTNVLLLRRYWTRPIDPDDIAKTKDAFGGKPHLKLQDLIAAGTSRAVVLALIARGILAIDIAVPFGPQSTIWLSEES